MSSLKWTDELSVGNAGLDQQHKDLFALIDRLAQDTSQLSYAFGKLDEYVHRHFKDEEELLRAAGYPDLDAHLRLHEEFYQWLEAMKKTIAAAPDSATNVGHNLHGFLTQWLSDHIMHADQAYKDWIKP